MEEATELADYLPLSFKRPKEQGDVIALRNMYRASV